MQKNIIEFIDRISQDFKKRLVVLLDTCVCIVIFFFCFIAVGNSYHNFDFQTALSFSILHLLLSFTFKNYQIIWDLFGYRDVQSIALSTFFASCATAAITLSALGIYFYSLLFVLSFFSIIFSRVIYSNWRVLFRERVEGENCLILGAGEAGAQLLLQLKNSPKLKINPVGFLDDSSTVKNRKIHGIPVVGKICDIKKVAKKLGITKALVAIPSGQSAQLRVIYRAVLDAGVELRTLPSLTDILDGKVDPFQIKEIEPQDLLGRAPINLDKEFMNETFFNKTIMITGAGGSIGSELCTQIAQYSPRTMVLFEQTELFLYQTEMNLSAQFPKVNFIATIGDVRDYDSLEKIVSQCKPDVLFHAAAYKHVPLMEKNPGEAVLTNVIGTSNAAIIAGKYSVPRFVLVSTDKAVNPTNIMGATKRAAEMACQICVEDYSETKYMVVRFGNVLGSSGSVIPLFKQQISNGGPITITDERVVRYFMSIPEACQLVMQASAIGCGGELFVLDMGDPVKIVDLAADMIRLSGFEPHVDIEIKFIGLRPGEKLYEEMLSDKELTLETGHPKIRMAKCLKSDHKIREGIANLHSVGRNSDAIFVVKSLQALIPEFTHR